MKEENGKQMSRRGFLKMGATASVAMGLSMAVPPAVADTLGISSKQGLTDRGESPCHFRDTASIRRIFTNFAL